MSTIQDWEQAEQAMTECAKRAWANEGGCELYGWYQHSMTAIVAYGNPPRARQEYQYAFLFERAERLHLVTIGKAPWHKTLYWRGTRLTDKSTLFRTYPIGLWTTEA